MKVAIIGGGASGIACAVSLKRKNRQISVTVYEKLPRILKKLLVTGNGRCNLTNVNSSPDFYRGDAALAKAALEKYPYDSSIAFFASLGLVTRVEAEGRVYPVSSQAASVVSVLLNEAVSLGVDIVTETAVNSIVKSGDVFIINGKYMADRVVIASGGSAAGAQGTEGDSFKLLKSLGVKFASPRPALTGIIIGGFPKSLKGVRSRCEVSLYKGAERLYSETGEVQFNDYGISGIPVMQLSGLLEKEGDFTITLDFLPDFDRKYIYDFLFNQQSSYPDKTAELLISGLLPKALGNYILLESGIRKDTVLKDIPSKRLEKLSSIIKSKRYTDLTARGFEYAQVTAGGVVADEINPDTLELRKHKGIFVTGEALNADGLCGGHNLQFAWSTGRLAADSILEEI